MLHFELDIKPPPGPPRLNNLAQRDIKSSHLRPLLKVTYLSVVVANLTRMHDTGSNVSASTADNQGTGVFIPGIGFVVIERKKERPEAYEVITSNVQPRAWDP